jgi:hypothetical protein
MIYVTYKDLTMRFGSKGAHSIIRTIEKLARIQEEIVTPIDQEARLQHALESLNDIGASL